jgi:hypothetical protein
MFKFCTQITSQIIVASFVLFQTANLSLLASVVPGSKPDRASMAIGKFTLAQNLTPKQVIMGMYQGMRQVENDRGTPALKVINRGVTLKPLTTLEARIR